MQGKGKSLRLSLMALVVVLIFGAMGGLTLARDAFDADYNDCPAVTRLDAIEGLTIDRTDEEDEIRVSWDALDSATLSRLGPNGYRARLTIIVEGQDAMNVALGDTSLVVDDIDFTRALTVSVAVTLSNYVISDIKEADFTSGMPAPKFTGGVWASRNAIARAPDAEGAPTRAENDLVGITDSVVGGEGKAEIAADKADIIFLAKTAVDDEADVLEGARDTYNGLATKNDLARDEYIGALVTAQPPREDAASTAFDNAREKAVLDAANVVIDGDDGPVLNSDKEPMSIGSFHYLGFNDLFDNWYSDSSVLNKPSSPRFRVGLQHGNGELDPDEANFTNYRIVIEDSSGDLLGYQAETVSASRTYDGNKIVFSTDRTAGELDTDGAEAHAVFLARGAAAEGAAEGALFVPNSIDDFANLRLSNKVSDRAVSPYYERGWIVRFTGNRSDLSVGNVGLVDAENDVFPAENVVYVDAPVEYFDFPNNVFESDGSYIIKAWAEDKDGTRISPQARIKVSVQEGQPVDDSGFRGYALTGEGATVRDKIRSWGADGGSVSLTVYGFSLQED